VDLTARGTSALLVIKTGCRKLRGTKIVALSQTSALRKSTTETNMLTIYHAPGTRSLRVIWLCEELGLPCTVKTVDFSPAYRASPEWRALNPVGKVPVMTDGDFTMFESGAMVQYLLDRYGEGRLQPKPGTEAHGIYLQWSWFAESTYARPIGEIVNHGRAFGEKGRIPAVVEEMAARARLSSEAVDRAVSDRPYLLGDEFSAADIMMGYTIMIAEKFASIEGLDSLNAYWQRLKARPAYQRAAAA
jgi:glutathione S-transferase